MIGALILSALVLFVAMTTVAYMTWLERKVAARFQNRVGPYQVGVPHGWLQPLADIMKLIVKEDITPRAADRVLFNLGPVLVVVPALLGFAFIPLAPGLAVADHAYSFLFFLALASLTLLGVFAAGWSSNNKYALLSALRMVALVASYEIPMILALLVPAALAGSLSLSGIVEAQRGLWFALVPGVGQIALLLFLICALAEGNKSPLDLLEAESELIAAYNVEYSGIKFALFYAGEYAHTLAMCSLAATVFFGGYLGPSFLPGFVWLFLKSVVLFVGVLWIRWSLMRVRIDQALRLNWVVLLPVALLNVFAAAFWASGK
ncbi:MAG TPA: NADH-quinone oxidoreductase subunit NuoH [Candidatus Polarisedimenticolaceae bacterium]|nr:NADH-quinone oxidoreductase subunit NuoH [Candidatus Polarisedimenticolaceae bacterium]